MDKDIKESREYRLAKDWEMAVKQLQFQSGSICSSNTDHAPDTAAKPV